MVTWDVLQTQQAWKREEEAASGQEQALPRATRVSATELCPAWVHTATAAGEGTPRCLGEPGKPRKASDRSRSAIRAEGMSVALLASVSTAEIGERR